MKKQRVVDVARADFGRPQIPDISYVNRRLRPSPGTVSYYLPEVILGMTGTGGPVGARQRVPCTVHTRTDIMSSHAAAHKHSSTHIRTVLLHISVRSRPSTRIR